MDTNGLATDVLREEADKLRTRWSVRRNEYLDVDYRVEEDNSINIHVYPSVPRFTEFPGGAEKFAKEVERAVVKVLGKAVEVVAELYYEDGEVIEYDRDGKEVRIRKDTREIAPYRNPDGSHKPIFHGLPVHKLWLKIEKTPGIFMSRDEIAEIVCENILATAKKLAL